LCAALSAVWVAVPSRSSDAAPECMQVALKLLETAIDYQVQEGVLVIQTILRKYPGHFDHALPAVASAKEWCIEPEAKGALVWIMGSYPLQVPQAFEVLASFIDSFKDEVVQVQQQILDAVVKAFLCSPASLKSDVQRLLEIATKCDHADVRDHAFVYWRLLSASPEAAKDIVLATKPAVRFGSEKLSSEVLNELLRNMSTVASVFHQPPANFAGSPLDFKEKFVTDDPLSLERPVQTEASQAPEDNGDLLIVL